MLQGLKKLFFGQPDHNDEGLPFDDAALDGASLDELIQMNIELGRQIDELREKRKALKALIDPILLEIVVRKGN